LKGACAKTAAFKRAQVAPRGHGLRFSVTRRVAQRFSVEVLRMTRGTRVLTGKRVAHFTRAGSFSWHGKGASNGYYVVRFRLGSDTRRVALYRSHGRFHRRPAMATRGCTLIRTATLSNPVFGGSNHARMKLAFRLIRKGAVTVTIRHGKRVVKRTRFRQAGTRTHHISLKAGRLARGDYRVTIAATAASLKQSARLTARKL
jgi:hypothetical protein